MPFQTDPSTFFGNPDLSWAEVKANIVTGSVEHIFDNGLVVKSASRYASYDKFYQNVFPDNANIGSVNPTTLQLGLMAYNNAVQRDNIFNQTDWTYKTNTGPILHTFLFGTDIGRQTSDTLRNSGKFVTSGGLVNSINVPALNPTNFTPVVFNHLATDPNGYSTLNLAAAYAQDQIEITRYLQLIAGVRFDHFDLTFTERNQNKTFNRVDDFVSPRAGVVFKPVDNVSIYSSYSVSYLPSAGDQFGSLTAGTAIADPEKFENVEVGAKWDIAPRLQFTTAIYNLDRYNQRLPDPNNAGFFLLTGKTVTKGFETAATGYVTDAWQITGGYAYTDARIASGTSGTVTAGNRVGLVPYNTFTLWNRYQFNPVWGGGVGVIHYEDFFATSDDKVRLHGFTRVDAALYFRVNQNWRGQFNVENIFDTNYFSTADGNNNISPGSPRTFRVSATANF